MLHSAGNTLKTLIGFAMRPHSAQKLLRPKLSTMPRQKTEAAALLNLYKLAIEKKRLQQELQSIEERRQQILSQLATLDRQLAAQETNSQSLLDRTALSQLNAAPANSTLDTFEMQFLDY